MKEAFYPYFNGQLRSEAYHRPAKYFMSSSKPDFNSIYSFDINCLDKRQFMYYDSTTIRVHGDRHNMAGDWLVTPPPFLYLMGNKEAKQWVTLGLVVRKGENNFLEYQYSGGEGFGLNVTYDGYTKVKKQWDSPQILLQPCGEDVYGALTTYTNHLMDSGCVTKVDRSQSPRWWFEPIFGGWGEQVYFSNRWDNYLLNNPAGILGDDTYQYCTQSAYEKMLSTLESKGINPTILIIDNRWFEVTDQLSVDKQTWPTMKDFVQRQHAKGRKVILWVSPWSYCKSSKSGQDIPLSESMILDESNSYTLDIDTDVFYEKCGREKRKVRRDPAFKTKKITEHDPHWQFVADPLNPAYEDRLRKKIDYLISTDGLDADGFEFDYTHFLPLHRGFLPLHEHEIVWGAELMKRLLWIYYDQMKKSKSDALSISHSYNPYFNDVVDMLRLQDIYTDRRSIVPEMTHRAYVAKAVCPGCAIHTDQHAMPSLAHWREYAKHQPLLGNPCLYYVTGIETTKEKLTDSDFEMLKKIWSEHSKTLDKRFVAK
jgi:hypothetical protein